MNLKLSYIYIYSRNSMKFILNNLYYIILASAAGSLITSLLVWFSGDKLSALYIGLWVPSILSVGSFLKTWDKS